MKEKLLIILLYEDDMLIASDNYAKLNEAKCELQYEFEMTNWGKPNVFLGIDVS